MTLGALGVAALLTVASAACGGAETQQPVVIAPAPSATATAEPTIDPSASAEPPPAPPNPTTTASGGQKRPPRRGEPTQPDRPNPIPLYGCPPVPLDDEIV